MKHRIFAFHPERKKLVLSLVILLSLLLAAFSPAFSVAAEEPESIPEGFPTTLPESQEAEEFPSKNPAKKQELLRVRDEETDLHSRIYAAADGTRTLEYYPTAVKYKTEKGDVRDISLKFEANGSRGYSAAEHYLDISLPEKLSDEILMHYKDMGIRTRPILDGDVPTAEISEDGETVFYSFEESIYEYRLTYDGLKEDIIVPVYTGQTEYAFQMSFTGVTPVCIENNRNREWLLLNADGKVCGSLGDVWITTADEKNNTFGRLSLTMQEDGTYLAIISVDAEYLADERTAYPICIDPTKTIQYDEEDSDSWNDIEDITVNQNYATDVPYSGTLYIGRAVAAYGAMRSVVRFPDLSISGIYAANIQSAVLSFRDLMCYSTPIQVDCYGYSGTLPNTAFTATNMTWSSVEADVGGYEAAGIPHSSKTVCYNNGYQNNHIYSFDILSAVRSWVSGDSISASLQHGVVLKSTDAYEDSTASDFVCFGSYDRAVNKPYLAITYVTLQESLSNAPELYLNALATVSIAQAGEIDYFSFCPDENGFYTFLSLCPEDGEDPISTLFNENGERLSACDDYQSSLNYRLTYFLQESETYYYSAAYRTYDTGNFYAELRKANATDALIPADVETWEEGSSGWISISHAGEAKYYAFTPEETREYLFFSTECTNDPIFWLCDNHFGYMDNDDDSAGELNFRCSSVLQAGHTYYLTVACYSDNTAAMVFHSMYDPLLEETVYYLRNKESRLLVDYYYSGSTEGVRQSEAYSGGQERWFIHPGNGFYTICSEYDNQKCIGTSSPITASIAILSSTNNNSARWKIFVNLNNDVILETYQVPGRILSFPDTAVGTDMELDKLGLLNECSVLTLIEAIYGSQPFRELSPAVWGDINCFAYAMLLDEVPNSWDEATQYFWGPFPTNIDPVTNDFVLGTQQSVGIDMNRIFTCWLNENGIVFIPEPDFSPDNPTPLNVNQYRVVLRTGYHNYWSASNQQYISARDYHFWYQTYDGSWANKHGGNEAVHLADNITPFSSVTSGWDIPERPGFYDGPMYIYIITLEDNDNE